MSSDRIERLAKEYAERVFEKRIAEGGSTIVADIVRVAAHDAFRAGAAAGMAEHATTRRDTTEATQ